jgi:hypothetical protein
MDKGGNNPIKEKQSEVEREEEYRPFPIHQATNEALEIRQLTQLHVI